MVKKPKNAEPPVVVAGWEIAKALEQLEEMTGRVARQQVHERAHLARAGELLQKAADGHQRFLTHLAALGRAIDELRERLGASATVLAHEAQRIDERRAAYAALEQRFVQLGEGALRINTLVQELVGTDEPSPEKLGQIESQLSASANEADSLTEDARTAGFTDLETQAHARSQQLRSLHDKLAAIIQG